MRLCELRVRRLPGIDTPFTLTAAPGINLIVGPNGSGKSSLCRAVRALLWPRRESFTPLDLDSSWEVRGETWRASRQGQSDVVWQRGAAVTNAPTVPGDQLAGAYRLEIVDLLKTAPGATDRELAEEIRTRMAGGYNLEKIEREFFSDRTRIGYKEQQELQTAAKQVQTLSNEQRQLAAEEDELKTLRQRLDMGHAAAALLPLWHKEHELVTVGEQLARIAAECDAFEPVLADTTGQEQQQLAEIASNREQKQDDLTQPTERIVAAERQLAAADLPDGPPDPATVETWQERARTCGEMQSDLRRAERDLAEKEARLTSLGDTLNAEWDSTEATAINTETVAAVEAHLNETRPLRARSDGLAKLAVDVNLAPAVLPDLPETIVQGQQLLLDWLATVAVPAARRVRQATLAGCTLLSGIGLAASLFLDRSWGWLLVTAGAGGLVTLLLWGAVGRWSRSQSTARRQECVRRFGETGLPEPPSWTRDGVRQILARLESLAAAHDLERGKADLRQRLTAEQADLALLLSRREETRGELIRRCGLDATAADATLVEFSRRVAAYHTARQEYDGAAGRVTDLQRRLAENLRGIGDFLQTFGAEPSAEPSAAEAKANGAAGSQLPPVAAARRRLSGMDSAAAEAGLRDLARRGNDYQRAVDSLAADQAHHRQITAEVADLDRKEQAIYQRLHLVVGDVDGATHLVRRLTEYRSLQSEHERYGREQQRLIREVAQLREAVQATLGAPVEPAPESLSRQKLDDFIVRDDGLAREVERLRDRVTRIDERVKQARGGAALTGALAAHTAAADRLTERCVAAEDATLGRALLAAVRSEHEEVSRPPLLERTRELLRAFTHDSYELHVATGTDGALFRVTEATTGRGLGLEQLSAGTRAQLLLAARLAYLLEAESNETLPLFFDESLTTADPERFAAVVESLAAVVATDQRQIFYLTSDPADIARWQAVLREKSRPQAMVIDLGELRGQAAAASAAELALPPQPTVPASSGQDAATYGELIGVPRLDPFAATDSIHLFYLLRDRLDLLESLLRQHIVRLGQWRIASPLRRSELATDDAALLDARADVVDAYFAAWRIGRGRPVDRQALIASDCVSRRFLAEVLALCRRTGGDGATLVAGLQAGEVKGFRQEKARSVARYLTEHGYIDRRTPLADESLQERVHQAVAPRLKRGELSVSEVAALVHELSATVGS